MKQNALLFLFLFASQQSLSQSLPVFEDQSAITCARCEGPLSYEEVFLSRKMGQHLCSKCRTGSRGKGNEMSSVGPEDEAVYMHRFYNTIQKNRDSEYTCLSPSRVVKSMWTTSDTGWTVRACGNILHITKPNGRSFQSVLEGNFWAGKGRLQHGKVKIVGVNKLHDTLFLLIPAQQTELPELTEEEKRKIKSFEKTATTTSDYFRENFIGEATILAYDPTDQSTGPGGRFYKLNERTLLDEMKKRGFQGNEKEHYKANTAAYGQFFGGDYEQELGPNPDVEWWEKDKDLHKTTAV